MPSAQARKVKSLSKVKPGPVQSADGIPYDYIVVIDSGSHGSRAYVYNWLNPQYALEAGTDVTTTPKINLVRRLFGENSKSGQSSSDDDSDSDSDSNSDSESDMEKPIRFPRVNSGKKWHRAIKPGLSSFNESPQKVGKHHLSYLLNLASSVVPKSEHYRTPIFLHATAGMRLLPPNEQEPILENVCQYLTSNSDFFMPDCKSHVNIISGNIEGIYGWISVNYLEGSFDRPEEHQQGKNHTTYGLLDMGGASTQVVFQPNLTEIEEHKNNLHKLSLYTLPQVLNETEILPSAENPQYAPPNVSESNVYSDSFLGYGMSQAHSRYLKFLLEKFRKDNELPETAYRFRTPVTDPCLPKGYTFVGSVDNHNIDFTGNSDFQECLNSIFPVLENNTHASGNSNYNGNCQSLGEQSKVSSCLLDDKIPSFDFDINHFIGVSGYWDIVNSLLASSNLPIHDISTDKYDYNVIYKKTQQICSTSFNALLEMNLFRDKSAQIKEEDLAELCFKASWILNFLHVGLGFPRFGIDEDHNKDEKFKSLKLVDKFAGYSFSWTLGRAILYANDEYIQAYNNFTGRLDPSSVPLPRPGYVYTAAEENFILGAEQKKVESRPMYTKALADAKYPHYDYETKYTEPNESKWNITPHRLQGSLILISIVALLLFFMIGKSGRSTLRERVTSTYERAKDTTLRLLGRKSAIHYEHLDDSLPIEMSSIRSAKQSEEEDVFRIEEELE